MELIDSIGNVQGTVERLGAGEYAGFTAAGRIEIWGAVAVRRAVIPYAGEVRE